MSLLASPLFILKKLQYDAIKKYSFLLTGRVLDIGCGTKPYQRLIPAVSYIGLDDALAVHPDVCGSCLPLAFKESSFDSIICTELLEHVPEPAFCLSEIKRVLKSGGNLYLSAPQSWGLHYEPYDYWRFTRYGLEYLLGKEGFEVISIERIGGVFSLIGVRFVDVLWTRLTGGLSFLGAVWSQRSSTALCLGFSLGFYLAGIILDPIDKKDALGWAIVARKK
jgi:SAM-dependent methyltransferase